MIIDINLIERNSQSADPYQAKKEQIIKTNLSN